MMVSDFWLHDRTVSDCSVKKILYTFTFGVYYIYSIIKLIWERESYFKNHIWDDLWLVDKVNFLH